MKQSIRRYTLGACALITLNACNERDNVVGLGGAQSNAHFAVVSNNYEGAISVSLLDENGDVVEDDWVGSKTANPDLRIPLADDVVLPSTSPSRRYLTTIERGIGVVTRFDLNSGDVMGQVRTDTSDPEDKVAYHSNPQDVFYVSEESAWISRWAPNLDPDAADSEMGTDLIEFNPTTMERTKRRIDLSRFSADVEETQYDDAFNAIGTSTVKAHARPTMLAPAGKFLVVGLVRASASFSTYAEGRVAIVDRVAAKIIDNVSLKDLSNCGEVHAVADDASSVIVACTGNWGDGGAAAGIVKITVDAKGKAMISGDYRIADHDGAANTNGNVVSIGGDRVVAVASGAYDDAGTVVVAGDAAYVVDLKTDKQSKLVESKGAYALGAPAYNSITGVLLLPDAASYDEPEYGVWRFIVSPDGKVGKDTFVDVATDTTLPARGVQAL